MNEADKLFEELGRIKHIEEYSNYENDIDYLNEDKNDNICFDSKDKRVKFYGLKEEDLTVLEKQAIT